MAKIVAVKAAGKEDVYNMEVEGRHNFSVEGGLIVHNCYDGLGYGILSYHVGQSEYTREAAPMIRQHKEKVANRRKRRRY